MTSAKRYLYLLLLLAPSLFGSDSLPLSEAKESQQGAGLTQYDPVTGAPIILGWTLDEEVQASRQMEPEIIAAEEKKGFRVDSEQKAKARIERVMSALTKVSHLPTLPWRFHVSTNPDWNAFASMGGHILICKGLLDDVSDVELAGVLGHEIAHVTSRHSIKQLTHQGITGLLSERARSAFYRTGYSTELEAEADKVGILYMAMAGYDPRSVSPIWQRRLKLVGKGPSDHLHDHPLNDERARLTKNWGDVAFKYYRGEREINPEYGAILADNELVPRIGATGNETADFLSAALLEALKYRNNRDEAKRREEAAASEKAEQARKLKAWAFLKIEQVKVGKGRTFKTGVFADIKNTYNVAMKWVDIQFAYKTATGTWEAYGKPVRLLGLAPGETKNWGIAITDDSYLKAVFGARVVDLDY